MGRFGIIAQIDILQKHTLKIMKEYFQMQDPISEKIYSPAELAMQNAIQQAQQLRQKGWFEALSESRKKENVRMMLVKTVFQKYRKLIDTIQSEYPEIYQQHQGINFTHDAAADVYFHAILNDIQYIKMLATSIVSEKNYLNGIEREGIFFAGQSFDALKYIKNIYNLAGESIILIDGYIDENVLTILADRDMKIKIRLLTYKDMLPVSFTVMVQKFNQQYSRIMLRSSLAFHDRFIVIDDKEFFHFGASIKDAAHRKGFMFSKIEETDIIETLKRKFWNEWNKAEVMI